MGEERPDCAPRNCPDMPLIADDHPNLAMQMPRSRRAQHDDMHW